LQTSEHEEVPKGKKKSTSEQAKDQKPKKQKPPTLGLRCTPKSVVAATKALHQDTKDVLINCGFGGLFFLELTKNFSVQRIVYMMDKCNVTGAGPSFTIVLPDKEIEVTPEKVKRVFDLPDGTPDGNSKLDMGNWSQKFEEFKEKLFAGGFTTKKEKVNYEAVISYIKSVNEDKDEQARAWLTIVLAKLLFPTTDINILKQHVGMCSDLNWVKTFDWCSYLCQDMRNKIAAWKKKPAQSKVEGCGLLLLVSEDL